MVSIDVREIGRRQKRVRIRTRFKKRFVLLFVSWNECSNLKVKHPRGELIRFNIFRILSWLVLCGSPASEWIYKCQQSIINRFTRNFWRTAVILFLKLFSQIHKNLW